MNTTPVLIVLGIARCVLGQVVDDRDVIKRSQKEDGHWSAEEYGGAEWGDIRATGLMTIAYIADKERSQLYEETVRKAVGWLVKQQDVRGRIGFSDRASWQLDHVIATCCLVEYCRGADIKHGSVDVGRATEKAVEALCSMLTQSSRGIDSEVLAWSYAVVAALDEASTRAKMTATMPSVEHLSGRLREACGKEVIAEESLAGRSAAMFVEVLRKDLSEMPVSEGALPWPSDPLEDLMSVFYLTLAHNRVAGRAVDRQGDDRAWSGAMERTKEVAEGMHKNGHLYGSWDPAGPIGRTGGRIGMSGVANLVLLIRWRKCYLALCGRISLARPDLSTRQGR